MTTSKLLGIKQEQAMHTIRNNGSTWTLCCLGIALVVSVFGLLGCTGSAGHSKQIGFVSGADAANAFVKAMRQDDKDKLLKILGPDGKELIWSGDEVSDRQKREMFVKAYDEQHTINVEKDKGVLVVGKNDWPFPIPIVKENGKWVFDTVSGKEEILNRRIGRNELDTIQVMLAIVDAEREYATKDRDGDGILQYAQKFKSDPGNENGLYWETKEGQQPSPLGPLAAKARDEGYAKKKSSEEPSPYHGYFYRILTAQGARAGGGAYDYIVDGKMIGGFAAVAYPAEYGNSGVMTFIVNHDGVVYQKDLGSDTQQKAKAMERFDPDETWTKVQ
jgi:hypothetical protein